MLDIVLQKRIIAGFQSLYSLLVGGELSMRRVSNHGITQGRIQFEVHQLQEVVACRERRIALKEILIEIRLLIEQLCTLYANNTGSERGNQCWDQEAEYEPLCNRNANQRVTNRGKRRKNASPFEL